MAHMPTRISQLNPDRLTGSAPADGCRATAFRGRPLIQRTVRMVLAAALMTIAAANAEVVDRIVAIVNDDMILLSDLENAEHSYRQRMIQGGYSQAQQETALKEQRPQILEQLITQRITDQQVQRLKIQVSDSEIDAAIARIKEINNLSDERLLQKLELDGMTYDAFRKEITDQLLRSKLVNREVKSKIVITDEDVGAYYEKNREHYIGRTSYHLRHILIKHRPNEGPAKQKEALALAQRIYQRLKDGEDFAQLANVYSEAKSADQGGDLGEFDLRLLAEPIQKALAGREKGAFTEVVDTDQGYQIFYIEDVTESGGKSMEKVKAEIQEKLYAEIVDQKFQDWLTSLREQSHIQIIE
jgi:peptidyl-prolyl cis-trans isomerase SurA